MLTILVVDDQHCVRELVAEELTDEGYEVKTLGDAGLVKKYLQCFQIDLVLLDLFLEGPDGWDVLNQIKRHRPLLPVIVFTAYDNFRDDPRLAEADGYVIKSTDLKELKDKIARVLTAQRDLQGEVETRLYVPQISLAQPF